MTEMNDVIQELTNKTRSGELNWRASISSWSVKYGDGDFTINLNREIHFRGGGLMTASRLGFAGWAFMCLLESNFPLKSSADEKILQKALNCLRS